MRKQTDLEKKLIELGLRLSYKTYTGKHSEYVKEYVYEGVLEYEYNGCLVAVSIKVYIDPSRENVKDVKFNLNMQDYLNLVQLSQMYDIAESVYDYICRKIEGKI